MKPIESNLDAILVAIPMLLVMFASFFKLDEVIGSPSKPKTPVRRFSQQDARGNFVCVEPDGRGQRVIGARYAYGTMTEVDFDERFRG